MKLRTPLRNAADSSPGSGAAAGAPAAPAAGAPASAQTTPAQPQAQGAAFSAEAIRQIADVVRDGVFAELRRSGVLKDQKSRSGQPATPPAEGAAPPPVDPIRLRELDRAVTRAGLVDKLSPDAYRRLERAFVDESPDDASAWVGAYFEGFGVKSGSAPTTTTTATAAQPAAPSTTQPITPPASDRGAPPAPSTPPEELDLVRMTEADRNALIKDKGLKWFQTELMKQLKGRPVSSLRR